MIEEENAIKSVETSIKTLQTMDYRMAELESLARAIIRVHRDVDSGADIPFHIYKMALNAINETV